MRTLFAFFRRDFDNATSYKLSFILDILNIFLSIIGFYFLSKLIGNSADQYLAAYGIDYFSFYVVGAAFSVYFWSSFSSFTGVIQTGQANGTLEIMLASPTGLPTILIGSSLYGIFYSSVVGFLYLLAGFLLGVQFHFGNLLTVLTIFILTIVTFSAMGLLSAAFILVFKRADPLSWFIGSIGTLLGGALFPVTILPAWLQHVADFIPITYALDALRLSLLKGYALDALSHDVSALLIFTVTLLPLSIILFTRAIHWAKKTGGFLRY